MRIPCNNCLDYYHRCLDCVAATYELTSLQLRAIAYWMDNMGGAK